MRKTRDVLIRAERNGEEAVDKPHQKRTEHRRKQRDNNGKEGIEHARCRADRLLIEECADNAADAADVHYTGDTEVDITRFFGDYLTCRAEKERYALNDSALNYGNYHTRFSFPALRCMMR